MSASSALNLGYFGSTSAAINLPSSPHKSFLFNGTQPLQYLPPNQLIGLNHSATSSFKTNAPFKISVAAVDSSVPSEKQEVGSKRRYHFIVANAKFMLDEEEHFQEQLAERLRLYAERNTDQDFWLVIEPKFLDNFPAITNKLLRPAVALVSTNGSWITFMKLRLDRVLQDSFEADTLEEALASNPVNIEFEKPKKWTAPYPKYESGWWEPFLLPSSRTAQVG